MLILLSLFKITLRAESRSKTGCSAWVTSNLWGRRSPNVWTSQLLSLLLVKLFHRPKWQISLPFYILLRVKSLPFHIPLSGGPPRGGGWQCVLEYVIIIFLILYWNRHAKRLSSSSYKLTNYTQTTRIFPNPGQKSSFTRTLVKLPVSFQGILFPFTQFITPFFLISHKFLISTFTLPAKYTTYGGFCNKKWAFLDLSTRKIPPSTTRHKTSEGSRSLFVLRYLHTCRLSRFRRESHDFLTVVSRPHDKTPKLTVFGKYHYLVE